MRSSTAWSVPSARGRDVMATLVAALTSASEAFTTPRTFALSLSTSLRLAPSRDLTVTVLPSTFSIVPRTRTFWACAEVAAASAATTPAIASTRNFVFIWFPPSFLACLPALLPKAAAKCDGPMTALAARYRLVRSRALRAERSGASSYTSFSRRKAACRGTMTTPSCPGYSHNQGRLDLVNKISLDQGAQGLRDLWPHAEPALEPVHRLVQQHAEPVDRSQPTRFGGGKQRRLKRRVDQVADHGPGREQGKLNGQRRLAGHAERGRIHEQPRFGQADVYLIPSHRLDPVAKLGPQRCGTLRGAVGEANAPNAALKEAKDDGARRAAGAKHQRGRKAAIPTGRGGIKIGDEAFHVGIGRAQATTFEPERVGGADRARTIVRLGQGQRRLLVRHRDVRPDVAALQEARDESRELIRRHRLAPVLSIEAVLFDPIVVNERRAGVPDRPTDHTGGFALCHGTLTWTQ